MFWLSGRYVPAGLRYLSVWCGRQLTHRGLAHLTRLTALDTLSVTSFGDDEASDEEDHENWHWMHLTQDEVRAAAVIVRHDTVSSSTLCPQSKQSNCHCCRSSRSAAAAAAAAASVSCLPWSCIGPDTSKRR
jgi:hypothetical protein